MQKHRPKHPWFSQSFLGTGRKRYPKTTPKEIHPHAVIIFKIYSQEACALRTTKEIFEGSPNIP